MTVMWKGSQNTNLGIIGDMAAYRSLKNASGLDASTIAHVAEFC